MIHWKYCLIIIVVFISCFTLVKHTEKISKKSKIILQNLDSEYTESLTMIFNVLKQTSGQKN